MTPPHPPRVVVTGVGVVSSYGWGRETFWRGVSSGTAAIGTFRRFDHDRHRTHIAAEVPDPPAAAALLFGAGPRRRLAEVDRFSLFATGEALQHAGLELDLSRRDAGLYFGSSTGGMLETEAFYEALRRDVSAWHDLRLIASQQVSAPGNAAARRFRFTGPVQTVSSACATGALAVGMAFDAIRAGDVRLAVASGADSLCRTTYGGFNSLRSVDTHPCRPFRREREGLTLGEGGAAIVLERLEDALARGVTPLAELAGAGSADDAFHMTAPDPTGGGAAEALRRALAVADLPPEAVSFVNAHGTGTPLNDAAEWAALRAVFGERASELPVTATKGCVGHLLGSAGTLEAVATVLCVRHRVVHPTPGDGEIDPETPVNLVRGRPLPVDPLVAAASVNLGFGGCNAALVFTRWTEER